MKKHQRRKKFNARGGRGVGINKNYGVKVIREPAAGVRTSTILEVETRHERIRTLQEYEKQRNMLIALIYG